MEFSEMKTLISDSQWRISESIVDKIDEGMSQTRIAVEIGMTQSEVSVYVRVWRDFGNSGLNFSECYRKVRQNPRKTRPLKAGKL